MKRSQLIINFLLGAAIIVLFVLFFFIDGKNPEREGAEKTGPQRTTQTGAAIANRIAYVNIDSLLAGYDFYFDLQKRFDTRQKEMESELASRSRKLEQNANDLEQKFQKGLITRSQYQQEGQSLMQEQQSLMQRRNELTTQLTEEEQVLHRRLMNTITSFLKEYNQQHNYQLILSNTYGDNLLYAEDSMNITNEVTKELNEQYVKKREEMLAK